MDAVIFAAGKGTRLGPIKNFIPKPLVSIIIPCYNYAHFLPESVESVLNQSYKNVEAIIVNDGSTDNSSDVAEKYAEKYKNVKVINKTNSGISDSLNIAIHQSKCDYFSVISADDKLDLKAIERQVKVLEENKEYRFAYGYPQMFGSTNVKVLIPPVTSKGIFMGICVTVALFRREIFEKVQYDTNLNGLEDWEFTVQLAENGFKGILVPEVTWYYRIHRKPMTFKQILKSRWIWQKRFFKVVRKHIKGYSLGLLIKTVFLRIFLIFYGKLPPGLKDNIDKWIYNKGFGSYCVSLD